jgi:AsmA family protein
MAFFARKTRSRRHRVFWFVLGTPLVLVALLVGGYFLFWDWNYLRGYASERASGAAGRKIEIANIDVDLGWVTRIRLDGLNIANAPWAKAEALTKLEQAEVSIRLAPLLRGRLELPEVYLRKPEIALEKNAEGKSNWDFSENPAGVAAAETAAPDKRSEFPVIGTLRIEEGKARYVDQVQGLEVDLDISTAVGEAGRKDTLRLQGMGQLGGEPFKLDLVGGSILSLREGSEPYPFSINVQAGETQVAVEGTAQDPIQLSGFDASLKLSGPSLSKLFPVLGVALPPTPPYSIEGRLTRQETLWSFTDFAGKVGGSDLKGALQFRTGDDQARPRLTGRVVSSNLNFKDLGGLIGAGDDEKKDPNRVLPDAPIDLERLRAMDADVRFDAARIVGPAIPIEKLSTHVVLQNGIATLKPLKFTLAFGDIDGMLRLDGSREIPVVEIDTDLRRISLGELLPKNIGKESAGLLAGKVQLKGTGRSTAEVLGSADGHVSLFMAGGQLNLVIAELAGLDVAEAVTLLVGGKEKVHPIRCFVTDFDAKQGVLIPNAIVLDTTDTNITGEGSVSLKDEGLDLVIRPQPKDFSPLTLRAPILVRGSFAKPRVLPDPGTLAARVGAAAALGVVLTPLAALLPLIEAGLGKDSDCHGLVAQAAQSR